jgi:O-Antigen ligase
VVSRQSWSILYALTVLVALASLCLGGGTRHGFLNDAVLQFSAIPLLLAVLFRFAGRSEDGAAPVGPVISASLLCALPLLQLIPMPPEIWTRLPGRTVISETLSLTGQSLPWMPLSVSPQTTWLSAMSLLPPVSLFLGVVMLSLEKRRKLSIVFLSAGVVSVFLGLLQMAQGPSSPLRFYAMTNASEPVGFFANRNHFAALLYCTLVLAMLWAAKNLSVAERNTRAKTAQILLAAAALLSVIAIIAGELTARSRTGLVLSMFALLSALPFAAAFRASEDKNDQSRVAKVLLAAGAFTVLLSTQFVLFRVAERFAADPLGNQRVQFARNTWEAAKSFMPFGSGTGTFIQAYGLFDKPESAVANMFANRAHNDALELLLESGAFGLTIALVLLIWFVLRSAKVWRSPDVLGLVDPVDVSLARAGSLIIVLLLAHSLADYPLRTGAMMAVFAFAAGLLSVAPASHSYDAGAGHAATEVEVDLSFVPVPPVVAQHWDANVQPELQPPLPTRQNDTSTNEAWGVGEIWPDEWTVPKQTGGPTVKKP